MWSSSYTVPQSVYSGGICLAMCIERCYVREAGAFQAGILPNLCGCRVCVVSTCTNWGLNQWCLLWSLNSCNLPKYWETFLLYFMFSFDVVNFWTSVNSDANKGVKQLALSKPTVMGWVMTIKNIFILNAVKTEGMKVARTHRILEQQSPSGPIMEF